MSRVWAPCLDWKSQFSELMPYFQGKGGVVHIHAGPNAPVAAFSRALRNRLETENWPLPWSTVQIHSLNSNTHYVPDIVWQIQRTLGLTAETGSPPVNVNLGNDNRAKRDVLIRNVEIDVSFDRYGKSAQLWENVVQLRAFLESFLETRRVALVLVDTHEWTADQVMNFAYMLWNDTLENLINRGLLVIDIFDHERTIEPAHGWPPDPHCILNLPEHYDGQSRVDAHNDLAALAISLGWHPTPVEAEIFAGTILDASSNIRNVYAMLAQTRGRQRPGANA